MKIYDISKEFFSAQVFPGDPAPSQTPHYTIEKNGCNVTVLTMGSHNGTHMDAPTHFLTDAKTIDQVELEKCLGPCQVVKAEGTLDAQWVRQAMAGGVTRLLIGGKVEISVEAAKEMAALGLVFLGVEAMSVGPGEVHKALLGAEIALLEACVLADVPQGPYFLASLPLKLGALDGSPVRAVLIEGLGEVSA